MTTDLWCLVVLTLWTIPLFYAAPIGKMRRVGVGWGISSREVEPPMEPWMGRAERASNNHKENLPMFAIIVLILHVTGKHDDVTAATSMVYVVSRMLHAVFYWFAIETLALRSVVYFVALGALFKTRQRLEQPNFMLVSRLA